MKYALRVVSAHFDSYDQSPYPGRNPFWTEHIERATLFEEPRADKQISLLPYTVEKVSEKDLARILFVELLMKS